MRRSSNGAGARSAQSLRPVFSDTLIIVASRTRAWTWGLVVAFLFLVGHVVAACSLSETGYLTDATVCTAGQVICGGACTTLDHDNFNCGGCGLACGAG